MSVPQARTSLSISSKSNRNQMVEKTWEFKIAYIIGSLIEMASLLNRCSFNAQICSYQKNHEMKKAATVHQDKYKTK